MRKLTRIAVAAMAALATASCSANQGKTVTLTCTDIQLTVLDETMPGTDPQTKQPLTLHAARVAAGFRAEQGTDITGVVFNFSDPQRKINMPGPRVDNGPMEVYLPEGEIVVGGTIFGKSQGSSEDDLSAECSPQTFTVS